MYKYKYKKHNVSYRNKKLVSVVQRKNCWMILFMKNIQVKKQWNLS